MLPVILEVDSFPSVPAIHAFAVSECPSHVSQNSHYCVLAPEWSIPPVPSVQGRLLCHLFVHSTGEPSNRLLHLSYIFHFHNFRLVSSQYFQLLLRSYFIFCRTFLISSVYALNQELISLFEHTYFLSDSLTEIYFTCLTLLRHHYYRIHNFWISRVVLVASLRFTYLSLHQPPSFQSKYLLCSRGIWMWYCWVCSSANSSLVQELSVWYKALYHSLTRMLSTRTITATWSSHHANIILAS